MLQNKEKVSKIDNSWKDFQQQYPYDLLGFIGKGTFGEVVKAIYRPTNEVVAIKLMRNCFENIYNAKKELSEINILRKFTEV